MPSAVHFYWNKRRTRRSSLIVALIAVAGLPLLLQDDFDGIVLALGWFAAFALLAAAVYRRGSRTDPVLTVSDAGILDRRISSQVLPWEAISRVETFEAENVPFVGLNFHEPGAALAKAGPLARFSAPLHGLIGFPAVSINTGLLDGGDADLIGAIRCFRPDLVSAH